MNRKLTALIIDDDNDLSFMLGEILKSRNMDVSMVSSLSDAKKEITRGVPAIIVLDNTLPDGWGSEFIPYLNETCPDTKIILITADYESSEEDFPGITQFIHKPFTLSKFRNIIDHYL
jgi:DNA-binding NtrC family response regulator